MATATARLNRIGVLTGGGDCPGLNAVVRSVAKPAMSFFECTVVGILDGFEGLVEGRMRELSRLDVSGIINLGGTILGTSNKGDPFHYAANSADGVKIVDASDKALRHYREWGLGALVVIGGDGTMNIAHKFTDMGMNVVGVPKTIDNDLEATDQAFGYDSALVVATEAIDRLQTTASAHKRVMVVEVMGRHAGWIALGAGLAGGADIILIPEIPFQWDVIYKYCVKRSKTAKFTIICVAEGARPAKGELVVKEKDVKRTDPVRLGGIGDLVAKKVSAETGLETRVAVLGHLQRGGTPSPFDRILATKFGSMATQLASEGKFGHMVSLRGTDVVSVPLKDAAERQRLVPPDHQMICAARAVGTSFGD
ncbi:MAG: ATP-dependent 6-phosphofructokinase [Bacteroidota bacterium]